MRTLLLAALTLLVALAPAGAAVTADAPAATSLEEGPTAPGSNAPWARHAVQDLTRATVANDADGDKLFDELEDRFLATTGPVDAIVLFTPGTSTPEGLAQAREVAPGLAPTHTYHILPGFAAPLTLDQALNLAGLDVVRQLEWDTPGTLELDTATAVMGADVVQDELGLDGDRDGDPTTYTAQDVTIAVLDTGFHGDHQDLDEGKIVRFLDLGNGEEDPYDPHGHGTHVASIAAGSGDADPAYRGVAPGAGIVGIKIVDDDGQTSSESLAIEGYQWIVDHQQELGIDVSTISFGFGTATDGTTALELAVDQVWEAGVVNFKSTGNGGPERRTITVPAAARGILATGAMLDPRGSGAGGLLGTGIAAEFGFQLATFSSRGPTTDGRVKPDITAPGVSITAAQAGTQDGYVAFSGTSMASPFAAGTAALVLDANPRLTPDQVREVLTGTTEDWGLEGDDVDYGWGRLQVARAVAHAAADNGTLLEVTPPQVPFHETRSGVLASAVDTDPGTLLGTQTLEVNDTENPLAVTAIVEGTLVELLVEDPAGDLVASFQPLNPAARQHVVGFEPTETGTYTIRLVGQPQASYVIDVSHGTAPSLTVELPQLPIEGASLEGERADATPLGSAMGLIALAGAALALARRRRQA